VLQRRTGDIVELEEAGGSNLFICGVKETVMAMFKSTSMDKGFRMSRSEEEAIVTLPE
jgi:anti-anti-sigma regulatory factor